MVTADLEPLLARLADPAPVRETEAYRAGTLRPDGRVDLCKQGLGVAGLRRVLPAALASPHARHLLLGTNALGRDGAAALATALDTDHHVRTLYLGCNGIDATGVAPLLATLTGDRTVRALWLKRNPLGDDGVAAVADALRRNPTLRTVDLVHTGVTAAGLRVLVDALVGRAAPVERLFLGGNGLGPDAAPLLVALVRDAGVRELYLSANRLGDAGATTLAGGLPHHPTAFGLGGNGIGPAGARALANALDRLDALDLGRPPSERVLGATTNTCGDEGATALAAALPQAAALRRLDLAYTGLTGRGAKLLLAAIDPGTTALEQLRLGPGVPRRAKRAIAARLRPAAAPHPDIAAIGSVYR